MIHERPNKILRKELQQLSDSNILENFVHSDVKLMREAMYRARQKMHPKTPKSIEEALEQLYNMQSSLTCNGSEGRFCFVSETKSLALFTSSRNLQMLCQSDVVFGDGTFCYAPCHFCQLYTVHVYINRFYLPIVYCFLKSKSENDYTSMWTEIKKLCKDLIKTDLQVKLFFADFEVGAHNAVLKLFPSSVVKCCRFHLTQNWFKRIQKHRNLLLAYKQKDNEIGAWLKHFFALPLLPPDLVSEGFAALIEIAPNSDDAMKFADYVLLNYIDVDAQFPPSLWADKPGYEPHTTNGPEAFHSKYNSQFYSSHPNIHLVIDVLKQIQIDTDLKINSIHKNLNNPIRQEQQSKLLCIDELWQQFQKNNIDLLTYLRRISRHFLSKSL